MAVMKMLVVPKGDINKSISKMHKTQRIKMKTVQDMKVETVPIRKSNIEGKLNMKNVGTKTRTS